MSDAIAHTPPAPVLTLPAVHAASDRPASNLLIAHTALTAKTYDAISRLIVTRALPPGSKLTADALSQQLGVSRTPVKEALNQLAAEDLVEVQPRIGTFVRGLGAEDIHEIYDLRLMIELHAGRHGVRAATPAHAVKLRELASRMADLVEDNRYTQGMYDRFEHFHRQFHEVIVESGGNGRLRKLYAKLNVHVRLAMVQALRGWRDADVVSAEHVSIAQAYEQRDPELLATTLIAHVERARDTILSVLPTVGGIL